MVFDSSGNMGGAGAPSTRHKPGRPVRGRADPGARTRLNLDWNDMGYFGTAIAIASRQWRSAGKALREEYALGPHGPWIIGLIASSQILYPSDLTHVLRCGRSLISAELNKLSEAGLINCRKSEGDGRQIELTLTPLGMAANARLAESLSDMLDEHLAGYSRADILYCAKLLRDFAGSTPEVA